MKNKISVDRIELMLYNEMYTYIRYDMRDDKFYLVDWNYYLEDEEVIQEISEKEWDTIREEYSLIDIRKERYLGNKKWCFYWK